MSSATLLHPAIEQELLELNDPAAFLNSISNDTPLNLIGATAVKLQQQLRVSTPGLRVRALQIVGSRSEEAFEDDIILVRRERLADALLPRSRTLVLDPILGGWLVGEADLLQEIAYKTFEWLVLPVFVTPEPFRLFFSHEFSFEEPLFDDAAQRRWCHSTSGQQATVFLHTGEGRGLQRFSFELTANNPGTFMCGFGNQIQGFAVAEGALTGRFSFVYALTDSPVEIKISFSGEPMLLNQPRDPRRALFFSFSGATLDSTDLPGQRGVQQSVAYANVLPPKGSDLKNDRAIRRCFHEKGFFEVLSLATPWSALTPLVGVRSIYDYQGTFAFRDSWAASFGFGISKTREYAMPALWYQARRTPSPESEWRSLE